MSYGVGEYNCTYSRTAKRVRSSSGHDTFGSKNHNLPGNRFFRGRPLRCDNFENQERRKSIAHGGEL